MALLLDFRSFHIGNPPSPEVDLQVHASADPSERVQLLFADRPRALRLVQGAVARALEGHVQGGVHAGGGLVLLAVFSNDAILCSGFCGNRTSHVVIEEVLLRSPYAGILGENRSGSDGKENEKYLGQRKNAHFLLIEGAQNNSVFSGRAIGEKLVPSTCCLNTAPPCSGSLWPLLLFVLRISVLAPLVRLQKSLMMHKFTKHFCRSVDLLHNILFHPSGVQYSSTVPVKGALKGITFISIKCKKNPWSLTFIFSFWSFQMKSCCDYEVSRAPERNFFLAVF